MAKEKLGKYEHWVVVYTYKKTIKRNLPDDWIYPRHHEKTGPVFWHYLFKSEIMLNCFGLKFSRYRPETGLYGINEYFLKDGSLSEGYDEKEGEKNRKAMVNFSRIKKSLSEKGLINAIQFQGSNAWGFELTKKGKQTAKRLLKLGTL